MKHINFFGVVIIAIMLATPSPTIKAASITWSLPSSITDDADIFTFGTLDRAYSMGYGLDSITVNKVMFARFGQNLINNSGKEIVTDGQTELVVSGEEDAIIANDKLPVYKFPNISVDYQALLSSGVRNQGSPWALILNGLVVGKTYFFQAWFGSHSGPKTSLVLSGGTGSAEIDTRTSCYLSGTFVADDTSQVIVVTPNFGLPLMHAFQLRLIDEGVSPAAIIKPPSQSMARMGDVATLMVLAKGNPKPLFQWQKINDNHAVDLVDNDLISGAKAGTLKFQALRINDAGEYRVIISNSYGSVTSSIVTLSVSTNTAINVAVNGIDPVVYTGTAVLPGGPNDFWNSIDARTSITNVPLLDAAGMTTQVTLTVVKSDGSATVHALLGGISFAATHVITIKHLLANELYDLVVFSAGGQINEGGVFSGAIDGIARGYPNQNARPGDFLLGTNYVENSMARSDGNGNITFIIKGNATAFPGGYYNGDFNGLQLTHVVVDKFTPIIAQQPQSEVAYEQQTVVLIASAASPLNEPLQYQWRKNTASGSSNLSDSDWVTGVHSNILTLKKIQAADDGSYQLKVSNSAGDIFSKPAVIQVLTNQLINVMVTDGGSMTHTGTAVLSGAPGDVWNRANACTGFNNMALADSRGVSTPVTLSLYKSDGFCLPHPLVGGISYARKHAITINNLLPNEFYDLVVFSVGNEIREGGVFSGAVNGIARGYPSRGYMPSEFLDGVNYVENHYATTDEHGILAFSIAPNSTVAPDGYPNCDFNGLQLMKVSLADHPPVITLPPESAKVYLRHQKKLNVQAVSPVNAPIRYQWQKITGKTARDLSDGRNILGANTSTLSFNPINTGDAGDYQVVVKNSFGVITSQVATVTLATNQLINVAVSGANPVFYRGMAVLDGTTNDLWNSVDCRGSFKNMPLFDAAGMATPVTLTLSKSEGSAIPHSLLGGISYATNHVVTINNLLPNEYYDVVVFSVGSMINEGGAFSGAITGIARGYEKQNTQPTHFVLGVNYVENQTAQSDAYGTITFTIKPNSTVMPDGYFNGDFNGLQIIEGLHAPHAPSTKVTEK